jgi:hypothetical protein
LAPGPFADPGRGRHNVVVEGLVQRIWRGHDVGARSSHVGKRMPTHFIGIGVSARLSGARHWCAQQEVELAISKYAWNVEVAVMRIRRLIAAIDHGGATSNVHRALTEKGFVYFGT